MTSRLLTIARHLRLNGKQGVTKRGVITGHKWFEQGKKINVLDSYMSYNDSENHSENAIVFLHGNPTSSYLWRNVIPHTQGIARCLAPDLIGMGQSGKSGNGSYRFVDHYKYLSAWFDLVNLPNEIVVVCHDWGSGLGFHWCHQNPTKVKAIVHMESIVGTIKSWNSWPEIARNIFQAIRSDAGEEIILKKNLFVDRILPTSVMRDLTLEETEAYNMPYKEEGESRRPTLTWPREIPVEGEGPGDVIKIVNDYNEFLATSKIPKLFIEAEPGFFSKGIKKVALQWPNTSTVKVDGLHFLQEDSPEEIGISIRSFVEKL